MGGECCEETAVEYNYGGTADCGEGIEWGVVGLNEIRKSLSFAPFMHHPFTNELHSYHSRFTEEQIFITRSKELWQQSAELAYQRTHFVPGHFTASAFVVNHARTKTILIQHPKYHFWVQPGGHIEAGETPAQAGLREAQEETGLHQLTLHPALFDIDIHPIPAKGNEPAHEHFDLRFLVIAK